MVALPWQQNIHAIIHLKFQLFIHSQMKILLLPFLASSSCSSSSCSSSSVHAKKQCPTSYSCGSNSTLPIRYLGFVDSRLIHTISYVPARASTAATASITSAVVMGIVFTICLLFLFKRRGSRDEINAPNMQPETATDTTAPPHQEGLDDSKINTCTALVVINESKTNSGQDSSSYICPICLEGYKFQDIVRSIAKCEHCFHADCIELWLRKNITCPVCRTALPDVES